MFDVKRSFETYLAARLTAAINGLSFYASKGGRPEDQSAIAGDVEPPLGIVVVNQAEEVATGSNVYALEGSVIIISHLKDTGSGEQSQWVAQAKNEIDNLNSDCHPQSLTPPGFDLTIHGIDPGIINSKGSPDDDAHADTILFTAGVTIFDQLTPTE